MNRPETRFRTLWISDTHLGARTSQPEHLLDFLERHDADRIYLVGDLIDGLQLRRRWYWHPCKDRILALLIDKQSRGCEVIYIPGNHDAFMRHYIGHSVAGVAVRNDAVHETADGRRLWVLHGDGYDGVLPMAPWLALLGGRVYAATIWLNHWQGRIRRRLGLPHWSLALWLSQKSGKARKFVDAFEQAVSEAAARRGYDGVVCGHIHRPAIKNIAGVQYYNTGDWMDSCTALVEPHRGPIRLVRWFKPREQTVPATVPLLEHGVAVTGG